MRENIIYYQQQQTNEHSLTIATSIGRMKNKIQQQQQMNK